MENACVVVHVVFCGLDFFFLFHLLHALLRVCHTAYKCELNYIAEDFSRGNGIIVTSFFKLPLHIFAPFSTYFIVSTHPGLS